MKHGSKCGIPPVELPREELNHTRLRRSAKNDEGRTLELIVVLSKGLLDQYGDKEATDKTSKRRPLIERYESVYKTPGFFMLLSNSPKS